MNKYYTTSLLFIGLLSLYCCKKDTIPPITPITSTGLFSAKVDTTSFSSDPFSIDSLTGQYLGTYASIVGGTTPQLSVIGQKNNPNDTSHTSISFFTATVALGRYTSALPVSAPGFCDFKYARGIVGNEVVWHTDGPDSGSVIITKLDTINKLVSGTFSFTAFSVSASPATHVITQGVFTDVSVKP